MKVTTTILSLSLSAITILPATASDLCSSDRASWIQQTLNSSASTKSTKKALTLSGKVTTSTSITSTSGSNLSHSVAGLFPGVKMRAFVPNRYLPSEHDIELAQTQASAQTEANAPQLPASTVQLAKAMAQTQAMTNAQRQMQGGVAYTGGYTNMSGGLGANAPARSRMNSMQARMNALDAAIPEPMSSNETIGQIRSTLRSTAQRGQLIATASTGNNEYSANAYPDIVSPVPTQATVNTKSAQPSPLSFLSKNSTRQLGNTNGVGNANYSSYNSNGSAATYGSYRGQQSQGQQYAQRSAVAQRPSASLTFGGFQSYTGKVHVQAPSVRNYGQAQQSTTQNRAATYTSSLPADCNIASADCYSASSSTKIASYASYASGQSSSSLPY